MKKGVIKVPIFKFKIENDAWEPMDDDEYKKHIQITLLATLKAAVSEKEKATKAKLKSLFSKK